MAKNTAAFRAASIALTLLLALVGCDNRGSTGGTPTSGPSAEGGKNITVGFAQVGAESAWRTANSKSIQDEAAKRGITLKFSDAQQ
jgi:ABC-type sugar transport system substrate-binding protein